MEIIIPKKKQKIVKEREREREREKRKDQSFKKMNKK